MRIRHIACLLIFLAPLSTLGAHPHMWIDVTLDFELDRNGLEAVRVSWLFDEFNSAEMLFGFDENLDGEISPSEQEALRTNAFEHLVDVDYFVVGFAGNDRVDVGAARGFRADVIEGRLLYEFTVPVDVPWERIDNLVFGSFDSSYFIDFLSESAQDRYAGAGGTVVVSDETLRLSSEGWGTIRVPAVRADLN